MKKLTLFILTLALVVFAGIRSASAEDKTFVGVYGELDGSSWSVSDNWDPDGLPVDGDDVFINSASGSGSLYLDMDSGALHSLTVSSGWPLNHVDLAGFSLSALTQDIGVNSTGYVRHAVGSNFADSINIGIGNGYGSYSFGEEDLGGRLDARLLNVGVNWGGLFTQWSGEAAISQELVIGVESGSAGAYDLSGGTLSAENEFVGNWGYGNFYQAGGTNTVNNELILGRFADSGGTYDLIGGNLSASREIAGDAGGYGEFNQSGESIHEVLNDLIVGQDAGSGGFLNLFEDAQMTVHGNAYIGDEGGYGSFEQHDSSSLTVDNDLVLGARSESGPLFDSVGNYILGGGDLTVGGRMIVGDTGSGYFEQEAGTLNTGWQYVGYQGEGIFMLGAANHSVLNGLVIGDAPGAYGSYEMYEDDSYLTAGHVVVGGAATGAWFDEETEDPYFIEGARFTQSAGDVELAADGAWLDENDWEFKVSDDNPGGLVIGDQAGSTGVYDLSGGFLSTYKVAWVDENGDLVYEDDNIRYIGGNEIIGNSGQGTLNQSGGYNFAGFDVNLGQWAGSQGFYRLSDEAGDPELNAGRNLNIGLEGYGQFEQSGGSVNVGEGLILGTQASGVGVYQMSGGEAQTQWMHVGVDGNGSFDQTAGSFNASDNVTLGIYSGSVGSVTVTPAEDSDQSFFANELFIGRNGTGIFTQNGGDVTINHSLSINSAFEDAESTYFLNGGTLTKLEYETKIGTDNKGYFVQTGGDFILSGAMYLGDHNPGTPSYGLYTMTGGNLLNGETEGAGIVLGEWGGIGEFQQSGGTVMVNSLALGRQNDPSCGPGQGYYFMNAGTGDAPSLTLGDVQIGPAGIGVFTQNAGSHHVTGDMTIGRDAGGTGTYNLAGGSLMIDGQLSNGVDGAAIFNMTGGSLTAANAVNNGTFRVSEATATFTQSFVNNGMLQTDPAVLNFGTLSVGTGGVIQAQGDTYNVSGDFLNKSTMNAAWDTTQAALIFNGNPELGHTFELAGTEFGFDRSGYTSNFAWGTLDVTGVNELKLADGNIATPTAALYAGVVLGVQASGSQISNIFGNGFNIYYDETLAGNGYLGSSIYNLNNGGQLRPVGVVPEPISSVLFLVGAGVFGAAARKRRKL